MKKALLFLLLCLSATSCVDKAYDLENVDTDNITIGGETSEFKIPLVTVVVGMAEIKNGNVDIEQIFQEADIWLPSPLPENVAYVDFSQLADQTYVNSLTDALLAQVERDEKKRAEVRDLIWDAYRDDFLPVLNLPENVDKSDYEAAFNLAIETGMPEFQNEIRAIASRYITDINVEEMHYEVGNLDISSDIVDMLVDNLDPKETPNPKNTLHLYGEISSKLPISLLLHPAFSPSDVNFPVTMNAGTAVNKIDPTPATRLFGEDLRQIVDGLTINIPVTLQKYYPAMGFQPNEQQQIVITLRLVKRGGLTLNI